MDAGLVYIGFILCLYNTLYYKSIIKNFASGSSYISSSGCFITILDAKASATSWGCRWILLHRSHAGLKGLSIINYLSEKSLLSDCFYLYMNISFLNRCHGFSFLLPSTMTDHNVQCYIYYHMRIFKKVFISNRSCIIRVIYYYIITLISSTTLETH